MCISYCISDKRGENSFDTTEKRRRRRRRGGGEKAWKIGKFAQTKLMSSLSFKSHIFPQKKKYVIVMTLWSHLVCVCDSINMI